MGSVQDKDVKRFCDDVYTELTVMQKKIERMSGDITMTYGEDKVPFTTFQRHLKELAEQIEWKLQILSHACPFDWEGSREKVESIVSVQPDVPKGPDFSGGYVGG